MGRKGVAQPIRRNNRTASASRRRTANTLSTVVQDARLYIAGATKRRKAVCSDTMAFENPNTKTKARSCKDSTRVAAQEDSKKPYKISGDRGADPNLTLANSRVVERDKKEQSRDV
ncbi:MAG: hypothetical protein M1820_000110 [Bogoriella megaspora]|nr:MAG: hypothetical protein M1820_000110 [Bogoriella megaspora]